MLTQFYSPSLTNAKEKLFSPKRFENLDIKLDGHLDEEIWQQSQSINHWYRLTPDEGAPPSEKTTMWLAYDNEAIYLAAALEESNLSAIMTRSLERDSYSTEQDGICILLDTYNDNRTAYGFIITPAGVKTDIAISNDAEGFSQGWNANWNAFWDAAVAPSEEGWSAEVRIPFSSLRFENHDDLVEMGLILWRYLARNAEYDIFPEISNKWRNSAVKPSQALDIQFRGLKKRNPIYLKPYSLGGLNQNNLLREDKTGYHFANKWKRDIGLDIKYNLTSNLILDITANTDFAQVEVDDQRINTTRFSLFFPEKRDFFQERADLFNYRFPGGRQLLFQSRRIGIVSGETVPILGGVRLTGRTGAWEIGLIEMQTDKADIDDEEVASENFGILRVKREVFERGSYIGGMVTSRTDFEGNYNTVFAADCDIRLFGSQYLIVQVSQSLENGGEASNSRYGAIMLRRRIRKGLNFGTSLSYYGSGFNPAIGFLNRRGIMRNGSIFQYTWFPESKNRLQNHTLSNWASIIWRADSTRALETFDTRLSWSGLFKSGAKTGATARFRHESLIDTSSVSGIEILPGKYNFLTGQVEFGSPSGDAFRYEVKGSTGSFFGGWLASATLSPSWTLNEYLAFKLDYEFNRIEVGEQRLNAHVTRLRVRTAFNHAISINAFVQYNSAENILGANIRLRYNPVEGSDLYLVYNENINTLLDPEEKDSPHLPRTNSRAILLKYSYTFIK